MKVNRSRLLGLMGMAVLSALLIPESRAQDVAAEFRPVRVVPAFPPLSKFPVKPVKDAANLLNPAELVLGVTIGKESRAYPINMLTGPQREILNDRLGGRAIAATW